MRFIDSSNLKVPSDTKLLWLWWCVLRCKPRHIIISVTWGSCVGFFGVMFLILTMKPLYPAFPAVGDYMNTDITSGVLGLQDILLCRRSSWDKSDHIIIITVVLQFFWAFKIIWYSSIFSTNIQRGCRVSSQSTRSHTWAIWKPKIIWLLRWNQVWLLLD